MTIEQISATASQLEIPQKLNENTTVSANVQENYVPKSGAILTGLLTAPFVWLVIRWHSFNIRNRHQSPTRPKWYQHHHNGIDCWTYPDFLKINWIHQTKDNPNPEVDQEVADSYIKQVTHQFDKLLWCFSHGEIEGYVVRTLIKRWYAKGNVKHGTACCNEIITNLNLDGTIMKCPYGTEVIGSIDNPPTNEVLDSFFPEKCKSCEYWDICHCECVASVTGLDCYVNKTMIPTLRDLIKKHGVEKQVEELFQKPKFKS